jgi:putative oxidoreductase
MDSIARWYYAERTMRQPVERLAWRQFFPETMMDRARMIRWTRLIGVWAATLLLATIFIPQGLAKFSDTSGWATAFRHWGYPTWFRIAIGVIELGGIALMLWPRSAKWGAMAILVVMGGAWVTHIAFDGGRHMTSEVVPIVLASVVLWLRWKSVPPGWKLEALEKMS